MTGPPWLRDTIARRFALTIIVVIGLVFALANGAALLAGDWVRPSARGMGLVDRINDIVLLLEAVPPAGRQVAAAAVADGSFRVDVQAPGSAGAVSLDAAAHRQPPQPEVFAPEHGRQRLVLRLAGGSATTADRSVLDTGVGAGPGSYVLAVEVQDGGWVVFTAPTRFWGLDQKARNGIKLAVLTLTVIGISVAAAYQLSRPIRRFTEAVRRFGNDPRAAALPVAGPVELREAVRAFNAMQAKIQAFVSDRTAMLAAISHDLRTPLTKIRLRGEFIEDDDQRARLFRDVDDMQAMVDSALAFFRDDLQDEEVTTFDFPELLRTIADDYADQGHPVAYDGLDNLVHRGKPFALKRAFTNLVDNAVKYGHAPELELRCREDTVVVAVRDSGPGIPTTAFEEVFAPFYRLERSRNRATGGVGLGLTSARSVIQGHGGSITLHNRESGGLELRVTLPA
ncbi:HAMP domain-containing protein (plasmid) [Lichenicola cladoniae]|uniref:histidine kinase n=1 Tax=Lichenicola cladoniae TaxID=1484109 RepID=A0A6M8HZ33_9PROT|nr:ATP-binding protein [Lichenicola cladoniae]NPD69348.1 HAMP domain-containing protein [Acetobacteraceae bacterium]QKE93662.1 HAMP domain-containing protein [Lichenicola cladoniae]